jgi:hypothetical protein
VQAALHGGLEGPNLYVTRTELHELLARLFDANRAHDSAAAHYRVVDRAWRAADRFLPHGMKWQAGEKESGGAACH